MIILVKIGVMNAAHNAARSAVVWRSSHPTSQQEGLKRAKDKAYKSAVLSIAPYASGYDGHQQLWKYDYPGSVKGLKSYPRALAYANVYADLAQHSDAKKAMAEKEFVRRKYILASALTTVKLDKQHKNAFNEKLSVDVKFRMPIHIPGAGQIMGKLHWTRKGYYRDIRARATLPLETPESDTKTLGIEYDPDRL